MFPSTSASARENAAFTAHSKREDVDWNSLDKKKFFGAGVGVF